VGRHDDLSQAPLSVRFLYSLARPLRLPGRPREVSVTGGNCKSVSIIAVGCGSGIAAGEHVGSGGTANVDGWRGVTLEGSGRTNEICNVGRAGIATWEGGRERDLDNPVHDAPSPEEVTHYS